MSRRLLIHAGFHKTGTTTLQDTLFRNAATLLPHAEVYLQEGVLLTPLRRAVLGFSGNRCKATKAEITARAIDFFSLLDLSDPRPVLISSESLAGHFPGSSGVSKYGPAPIAIALIRDAWVTVTGSAAGFEVYYSTRRTGWLASCHWQRLKANRCTLSLTEFEAKYPEAADLDRILEDIRGRLGAEAVFTAAIEDIDHPVDPILALLGLSDLKPLLTLPRNANTFPGGDARDRLLALNRSNTWGAAYQKAREAIVNPTTTETPDQL